MIQILSLTLAVLLSQNSYACSCMQETLEEAYAKYHTIFRGKVGKVTKGKERTSVQFTVDTTWKGAAVKSITVTTANSSAACGYSFKAKEEYVVFGWKGPKDSSIIITSCSKTARAEDALETLAWLDQHHSTDDGD